MAAPPPHRRHRHLLLFQLLLLLAAAQPRLRSRPLLLAAGGRTKLPPAGPLGPGWSSPRRRWRSRPVSRLKAMWTTGDQKGGSGKSEEAAEEDGEAKKEQQEISSLRSIFGIPKPKSQNRKTPMFGPGRKKDPEDHGDESYEDIVKKTKNPHWKDGLAAWSAGFKESSSTFWNSTSFAFGTFKKDADVWLGEASQDLGTKFNNFSQSLLDNAAIAAANDFAQNWGQSIANSAAITAVREVMDTWGRPASVAAAGGVLFGGAWILRSFGGKPEAIPDPNGMDVSFLREGALSGVHGMGPETMIDWKHQFFALKKQMQQMQWELSYERRHAFEIDQLRMQAENELVSTKARLDELRDMFDRLLRGGERSSQSYRLSFGGSDGDNIFSNNGNFGGSGDGGRNNGAGGGGMMDDNNAEHGTQSFRKVDRDEDEQEDEQKNKDGSNPQSYWDTQGRQDTILNNKHSYSVNNQYTALDQQYSDALGLGSATLSNQATQQVPPTDPAMNIQME